MTVSVSFLGTRGSFPTGDTDKAVFGGNTACVEIRYGDFVFFIDSGSGINGLTKKINDEKLTNVYGFISHLHWDHICGFPAFLLGLNPSVKLTLFAGNDGDESHLPLQTALNRLMSPPFFPAPMTFARAEVTLIDFNSGETLNPVDGVTVATAPLNHPNGATGYRFDFNGKIIAYVSDTAHYPDRPDANVDLLTKNADLVIYDATYTDEEWQRFAVYGHSTCEEGIRLARRNGIKKLAFFHHATEHTDAFLQAKENELKQIFPNAFFAREKTTVIV